jgi:TetR/AcrR family transcriptional regulator, ethionamide resistance regulator
VWQDCDTVSTRVSQRRRVPRDEARRRIVAATARLLAGTRFRDLTVDAVMAEAGLARTVFYRHFDGLPHVVLGLLEELIDATARDAETAPDLNDPAVLHGMLARAVDLYAQHGALFLAIDEAARLDEEVERALHATVERAIELTTRLIEDAIEVGRVRPVSPPDMARALTLLNGNYLLDTLGREPREDPAVVLETLWTVWTGALGFRGVVTWGPDRV